MDLSHVTGFVVIGFVAWTVLAGNAQPPATLDGKEVVPYESTKFSPSAAPGDADSTISISARTGGVLGEVYTDHWGVVHQSPEQREHGTINVTVTPQEFASRWWYEGGPPYLDLGGTVLVAKHGVDQVAPAVRVSPCRWLYGSIAPDAVISERALGVGLSFYPPGRSVGYGWHHVGLGVYFLHPVRDGGPSGFAVGITSAIQ